MKKGDSVQLKITGISHQGHGIGRSDNIVVFVPGAMLGEVVEAEIIEYKKRMATAVLKEVLEPSEDRIEPICAQSDKCGGCEMQHCDYRYQMEAKQKIVEDALLRIGRVDTEVLPVIGMEEPFRYRNKGIFHTDYSNNGVRLGFFEPNSHAFVWAGDCHLFSRAVNDLVKYLEELIQNSGRAYYIKKVMIRESRYNGEIMIVLVTEDSAWRLPKFAEKLIEYPQVVSVYHNINTNPKVMLGRHFMLLEGKDTIEDTIGPFHFQISPQSFFQINNTQAAVLYGKVLEFADLDGTEQVADIYCGIGTISMFLAQKAKEVLAIESISQAVRDAKENAERNNVDNCTFVATKAEDWLPKWAKRGNILDVAVIDPPRKGCDPAVLDALITSNARKIVYVSCNPSTLARDVKYLAEYGYQVKKVQPVDMFCQTWHVETVVLLEKI